MPDQPEAQGPRSVPVKIDNENFSIRGNATEEYIRKLSRIVDQKVLEVRRNQPNLPRHRVAILAALNIADELERVKRENAELLDVLEEAR